MSVVSGLYEFVFATRTSERERLLAFWQALGFEPIGEGALSASEANKLYGHHAALQSIRLQHAGCAAHQTGLVRLQCWSELAGDGLAAHRPLVSGSRWMGMYTADILELRDSLNHYRSEVSDRWLSELVSAPLANPPPPVTLQTPFVGLRETLYFDPDGRVAFIQRGGFDRPGFGTIDLTLPYKNSEGSHANVVQPTGSFDTAFYKAVFGLESAPYGEAHDNTDLLAANNLPAPSSWADLTKPEYKGHVQMANPNSSGTAYTTLATMMQLFGEDGGFDFMKGLHSNINQYTKSGSAPIKAAGRGETTIGIVFMHDAVKQAVKGFPVKVVAPAEGTGYEIGSMSIIDGARNMKEAKAFYDWALSADAQNLALEVNAFQVPSNTGAKTSASAPDMSTIKLIDYDFKTYGSSATRKRLLKKWDDEVSVLAQ